VYVAANVTGGQKRGTTDFKNAVITPSNALVFVDHQSLTNHLAAHP
jgi:hypothetical protein